MSQRKEAGRLSFSKDRFKTARPVASLRQGRNDWYKIKNEDKLGRFAEIYIYDEIGFFGVTASDFVDELNAIDTQEIRLHINSPGGEVFDGIAIYEALRNHKATVTSQIDALAASAASYIALAGDTVTIAKPGTMMVHNAHGICIGNSDDMRKLADRMDKLNDIIADIYAEKTGDDREFWRNMMTEETWFNAEEALGVGLVDEIKDSKNKSDTENKWDLSVFNYQSRKEAPTPPKRTSFDADQIRQALEGAFK